MRSHSPSECYNGVFFTSAVRDVLVAGKILTDPDDQATLLEKLYRRLLASEATLAERRVGAERTVSQLQQYIENGQCILGSPLLTNVSANRPTLASCTAVPLDASALVSRDLELAEQYYKLNMGSGYNLDSHADPVAALRQLNSHAAATTAVGSCERYIGNIAHVSIHHPRAKDFAVAKVGHPELRHFNISIDVTDEFMSALAASATYRLRNGARVRTEDIWTSIVQSAWQCGDPGLISLARFNRDNAIAAVSPYITTAPCAEVGLATGEACVFGYINIAACVKRCAEGLSLDLGAIGDIAECLTRVLDDALQDSLTEFPTLASNKAMAGSRKIGVGVCGFADALLWLGIDYGSDESCDLLRAILSTINFRSKHASMVLASRRGPFPLFQASRYAIDPAFVERFAKHTTALAPNAWGDLRRAVAKYGIRNAMTTALPPSGRAALMLGVNSSIEPLLRSTKGHQLSLVEQSLVKGGVARRELDGSLRLVDRHSQSWPASAKSDTSLFRDARAIPYAEHLAVLRTASSLVDDGVSKTINLPASSTIDDVRRIYAGAWSAGVKAISIYRDTAFGHADVSSPEVRANWTFAPASAAQGRLAPPPM